MEFLIYSTVGKLSRPAFHF